MTRSIVPPVGPQNPGTGRVRAEKTTVFGTGGDPPPELQRDGPAQRLPKQPYCIDCAEVAFAALEEANEELDESEREGRDSLRLRSQLAALMVHFWGEWVCPRCERIDVGTRRLPQLVPFQAVFPNREARRSFEHFVGTAAFRRWGQ